MTLDFCKFKRTVEKELRRICKKYKMVEVLQESDRVIKNFYKLGLNKYHKQYDYCVKRIVREEKI